MGIGGLGFITYNMWELRKELLDSQRLIQESTQTRAAAAVTMEATQNLLSKIKIATPNLPVKGFTQNLWDSFTAFTSKLFSK